MDDTKVEPGSARAHWDGVYGQKDEREVSWFQERADTSLQLVARCGLGLDARIVDVGGGASRLVDGLLAAGFADVTVLDVAEAALTQARRRLGASGEAVAWIAADVTRWTPPRMFDLWHDRAVFHFLVEPDGRARYRQALARGLRRGGHAIIATFAPDGPERCSGLPVARYAPEALAAELGTELELVESLREDHRTPGGKVQRFQFSRFVRR